MRLLPVRLPATFVLLLPPIAWADVVQGQGLEHVKANYTKYEYRIPMRDGKRLFTAVYVPKDDTCSPINGLPRGGPTCWCFRRTCWRKI